MSERAGIVPGVVLLALAVSMAPALAQESGGTPAAPAAETPAAETPAAEQPASETPAAETPATEDAEPAKPTADVTPPAAPDGAAEAAAEADAPGPVRWTLSHLDVIRLNPLGLESQNRVLYQRRLQESDSILFANTYGAAGASLKLNPAFLKVGPVFEFQPIAVFHLRVAYEFMQFFGTFDFVQSYPEPTDPDGYADDNRADNGDAAYVTSGHHIYVEPTLQAKVGQVAIRSKFAIEWWKMDLEEGDRVWYDATLDTYVPGDGFVVTNDTDVLYLAGDIIAGLRLSWVNPVYRDEHFASGEIPDDFEGMSHLRVGPLGVYTLSERKGPVPVSHKVLANVSWYLSHPNREGAMPYILLGYAYNRDL